MVIKSFSRSSPILAIFLVFRRFRKIEPTRAFLPIFEQITCLPNGVLLLPSLLPIPYLDVETGYCLITFLPLITESLCLEILTTTAYWSGSTANCACNFFSLIRNFSTPLEEYVIVNFVHLKFVPIYHIVFCCIGKSRIPRCGSFWYLALIRLRRISIPRFPLDKRTFGTPGTEILNVRYDMVPHR